MIFKIPEIKLISQNAKFTVTRNRRIILTKDYREMKEYLAVEFERQTGGIMGAFINQDINWETIITFGTYKDIDNCIKPIHDALQECGFIIDDRKILKTTIIKNPQKRGSLDYLEVEVKEYE